MAKSPKTIRSEARAKRAEEAAALAAGDAEAAIAALRAELDEENDEAFRLQGIIISDEATAGEKEAALLARYEAETRASGLALRISHFEAKAAAAEG